VKVDTPTEVLRNWEALKAEEKRNGLKRREKRRMLMPKNPFWMGFVGDAWAIGGAQA